MNIDPSPIIKKRLGEVEFANCLLQAELDALRALHAQCPALDPAEESAPVPMKRPLKKPPSESQDGSAG